MRPVVGPMVICSVRPSAAKEAVELLGAAPAGCSWVELRADELSAPEVSYVLGRVERDLLVTVRAARDGGGYTGDEAGRMEILVAALRAGARAVDVELGSAAEALLATEDPERLVLSHHGGACDASSLAARYDQMTERRAARLKLIPEAGRVADLEAVRTILQRARGDRRDLCCFASGRAGALSRLLAPAWGAWATYGCLHLGAETAPGQFTAADLLEIHRVLTITPATRRYALFGSGVRRSPSPAMHTAAYRTHGLDARYFPVELDAADEVSGLCGPDGLAGFRGFAVTMPFKEELAVRCSAADEVTERCGSVNTVVTAPGAWQGYNTDGPASLQLLRTVADVADLPVSIAGAGGAARAVAASLAGARAGVTLFSRDADRGRRAAHAVGVSWAPWSELAEREWRVLVNATPLGSGGEEWLPARSFVGSVVLDMAYCPGGTPLTRRAQAAGLRVFDGIDQLVAQGVRQFRILTGVETSPEPMAAAAVQWLSRRSG